MSLIKKCIASSLKQTFNIKKSTEPTLFTVDNDNMYYSTVGYVSQDYDELRSHTKEPVAEFVSNGRWGCVVHHKLKATWKHRVKQVKVDDILYNVVPGQWSDDSVFYPDIADPDVRIEITPLGSGSGSNVVLLPHRVYDNSAPIPETDIPTLRIGGTELPCVHASTFCNLSVNRQGIYVNKKYRDKTDITSEVPVGATKLDRYIMKIWYADKELLSMAVN